MKEKILQAMDALYLTCIWSAGISIFIMSIIIPVGVFARYVLGFGAQWPEPIAILLMVVFTFLGAAASYRAGAHIAVAMLTDRISPPTQAACKVMVDIGMVAICLFGIVYGTSLCLGTMGQSLGELPWMPVGITYAPLPLGSLFTLVFVLEKMVFGSQHRRDVVTYDHSLEESDNKPAGA